MNRHPALYPADPSDMTAYDCEPNELLDETHACSVCEHGHSGFVCRWCIGLGKTTRRTA